MSLTPSTIVLSLFLASSAPAAPWVPNDCEGSLQEIAHVLGQEEKEVRARWNELRRLVTQAKTGDAYYAPRPYPRTRNEILADFRYAYFERLHDGGPKGLDKQERSIYEGLKAGSARLTIDRVENWDTSRCSPSRAAPYFHLIRIFDSGGGEMARAALHVTGLLGQYAQVTEVGTRAFTAIEETPERASRMLGQPLSPREIQYAAMDGLPVGCDALLPCTVFEAEGSVWVIAAGALLYEIPASARRLTVSEVRRQAAEERTLKPLGTVTVDRALVTQGFGWAEATLVGVDEELAELQGIETGSDEVDE